MHGERKHIRLSDWDYSSEGVYFITICCHDRESFFGRLIDKKMVISEIGKMAFQFWKEIPEHFYHVRIDEFVVMPNHIHGILILDYSLAGTRHGVSLHNTSNINVGPCHGMALHRNGTNQFSKPVKNSIPVIINQYKSTLKRWCNQNGFKYFRWQSRFYDHILRSEFSMNQVREYIITNPRNWLSDEMYK
jgi:putative transposase